MVSENLYTPIVLSLTVIYTITFGFCMYRTNKFNYFNDEWRHTKIFYISVIIQVFIRMNTYALLTFAVPQSARSNRWITLMRSAPETLFFINYLLLAYQTLNIFYHSHMENSIHISLLIHFTRPKFSKARKMIALFIVVWLGFMGFMYLLYITDVVTNSEIDTLFTITNLISGTFVLVFLMYLYTKYAETPFKTDVDRHNLQVASKVLLIWTLGRYFEGFLGLMNLKSASLLSYLSNPQSSTFGGASLFICQNIVSEIICFIIVMDYRFINIFVSQEVANRGKEESLLANAEKSNNQEINIDFPEVFIENSQVSFQGLLAKRKEGLGELFKGNFKGQEVVCRKIKFSRVSGYAIEDIKKELEELKEKNCTNLVFFYGAILALPEIVLITAPVPRSLFQLLHIDKVVLPLKEKKNIIRNIGFIVQSLHEKEIFHGHLSSHNLFLAEGNRPIVADFGLEKLKKLAGLMINYTNKSIWSSPKQLSDTSRTVAKPDSSDDIYSLGIIIWEIVTGEMPYSDLDTDDYKSEVLQNQATPRIKSFFPKDLTKLLKFCWAPLESRPDIKAIYSKISSLKMGET